MYVCVYICGWVGERHCVTVCLYAYMHVCLFACVPFLSGVGGCSCLHVVFKGKHCRRVCMCVKMRMCVRACVCMCELVYTQYI